MKNKGAHHRLERLVKLIVAGKASIHEVVVAMEQTELRFVPRRRIE